MVNLTEINNLRPTTRECVHLVTLGHFRSHDKDGGHTIQCAIAENPMIMQNMALFCRTRVITNGSFTSWELGFFLPFLLL